MTNRLISLILASVGASALIAATPAASATLVVNGGFQDGTNGGSLFEQVDVGETTIAGWTIGAGNVDWIHGYWKGSSGSTGDYSVDLSGLNSQGTIQQTIFGLVTGQAYSLTFDTALNPDFDDLPQSLSWALGSLGGSASGLLDPNLGWSANVFNFVWAEASTSALLVFTSTVGNNCCYGPALDNVALNAVPLPAALPLFAAGLGVMGYIGSRRRRKSAPAA